MKKNFKLWTIFATAYILFLFINERMLWAATPKILTENVYYHQTQKNISGFMARPADSGKHPALILIHEWWGLNENIKENARQFARAGYVALAVDLYDGRVATTRDRAKALAGEVRNDIEKAFENLNEALKYLKEQPKFVASDRIASIGWCFGGGWSYQMAKNDLGVKASVIYYGRFNPADDLSKMRATIIGHFAEKDRAIRADNVKEFQAKLKTLNGNHEIFIYPNTDHAFANPEGPNYNKEAAELAWQRTMDFLGKYL